MSDIDRSRTLTKLRDESPKDCTLGPGDRSWFCGAERYEEAIIDLEAVIAGAVEALERIRDHADSAEDPALLAQNELDRIKGTQ